MKTKSLLLTFLLFLSMLSTAWADEIITIVADGQTISDATTWENSTVNITGSGKVTFSKRITISGDVTLNLGAGATLTASFGITVNEGNSLTIAGDGTLNAGANNMFAAIGGTSRQNSGTINITGGTINATGRYGGAGIGGGIYGSATIINISGGNVTATGDSWSAGIGGGSKGNAGMITITGGVVSATGNYKGAGIGGGGDSENPGGGGTITISGGQVTATGGKDNGNPCGYGIGPGKGSPIDGKLGTISLSWTESTDFINASSYKGSISFEDRKRFYYDGTTDFVTADELANKLNQKIVPAVANNNSLEFADIQMPRYYITTNGTAVDVNYDVYDYDGNKLMLGTHYTAVIKNSGNEDVTTFDQLGDYTLTVTGTGTTYTGSKSFTFSLVEWDSNLSVDGSDHYINFPSDGTKKTVYLGKNQTIKVYDSEGKKGNLVPSDGRLMLYAPEGYALEVTGKTDAQFYASAQYWTWLKAYDGNDETETALITTIDQNRDNILFASAADGMLMRFYVYNGQGATEKYGLDLTVRVVEATPHNITVGTANNGSIASDKTSAKTNETITLTVNPANGYLLKRITVTDTDNGTTIATIGEDHWYSGVNTVTLQMPNKNITVTPEFANVLSIDDGLTLNIDPTRTIDYVIPDGVASFKIYGTADNGSTVTAVLKAPEGVRLKVASDYRYDVNYNLRYIDCTVGSTNSYIKIYDGENTSSALLKELTYNDRRIGTQTSTSNYITFEIHGSETSILQGIIEMEYSINYDLAGGSVAIENPVTYTYATADFTLNNPSKDGYEFAGWTGTGLDAASTNVTIAKGGYGNREYTATWKKLLTNSDITIAAIPNQTYTGLAIEPEVTVTDGETPLTLGSDYTVSYSANTNAGTATVTITGNGDYSGTVEKEFAITKATLTVTAKNKTIAYGDEPANDGVEYSGFASEEGASILSGILAYEYNYVQGDPPGEYSITPSGLTADNYEIEFVAGKLTVERKEITVSWGEQTSFVYNGTEQAPTATAEGLVDGDECLITVSGAKDVGSHTATATELSNDNYKLPTTGLEQTFEITKATLTITAKNKTIVYGDEPANDGVEYSGFVGEENASVLGGTLTYGYNYEKGNKTGEYVITPSGLTADNYEINFVSGKLTVETKKTTFAAIQIFEDENGKRAEIAGEYDGPDAVNITEDIADVAVTFNREFTPNSGHATIMFPFDVNASSLTGVKSVIEFTGITKIDGNNAVGMGYVWCNATLGQKEVDENHPNCNGYSGELKAYTPYMIEMESATLGIKDAVTLKSNSGKIVGDAPVGNWVFRGTLQKKEWPKGTGIINEGRLWAFSAAERSGAKIGEFVQFGGNNWANPFRAYLVECKKSGEDSWDCQDDSEPQPKASQVSRYRFADALAPTNSAEKLAGAVAMDEPLVMRQAAASETASLNSMDIVIVYGDKDSDKERPTVIGHFNPATGEIRMLPRTKQTYDLKGRKVGNGKKAKGAYYRR